jgi:hypothetical protein
LNSRPLFARDWPRFIGVYREQFGNFDAVSGILINGLDDAAYFDMVGVTGSIPVPPTIYQSLSESVLIFGRDWPRLAGLEGAG